MQDVGGTAFDTLKCTMIPKITNLSLDEPSLKDTVFVFVS